jgi:hypothetical protein
LSMMDFMVAASVEEDMPRIKTKKTSDLNIKTPPRHRQVFKPS